MSKPLPEIIIQGAIDIISDPKRWCSGEAAQDKEGMSCCATEITAATFCAEGALERAAFDLTDDFHEAARLGEEIAWKIAHSQKPMLSLNFTNDVKGRRAVIARMKRYLKETKA